MPGNISKGVTIFGVTGSAKCMRPTVDMDRDGHAGATDCIDYNPYVHPNTQWVAIAADPGSGCDWDCNGIITKIVEGGKDYVR